MSGGIHKNYWLFIFETWIAFKFSIEPPKILNEYRSLIQAKVMDRVQLTCPVQQQSKDLLFSWMKVLKWYRIFFYNNQNICISQDNESISISWVRLETKGAHLIIDDVEPEDSGKYVCIATNGFGSQRADILLIVTGINDCVSKKDFVQPCLFLWLLVKYRSFDGIDDNRPDGRVRKFQRLIDPRIEFHRGDAPSAETSAHHSRQFTRHPVRRRRIPSSGSHLAQGNISVPFWMDPICVIRFDKRNLYQLWMKQVFLILGWSLVSTMATKSTGRNRMESLTLDAFNPESFIRIVRQLHLLSIGSKRENSDDFYHQSFRLIESHFSIEL